VNAGKPVLLVEDDDLDVKTVRRAFKELHVTNPLARALHGEEALAWLRHQANGPPALILLDLSLPVMNGIEFLQAVKQDERLRRIPVVILTTSRLEADKLASFDLSVAGYLVKPVDYGQFVEVIRTLDMYWTLSETP
jgi:CheY-like chemotaxis protein